MGKFERNIHFCACSFFPPKEPSHPPKKRRRSPTSHQTKTARIHPRSRSLKAQHPAQARMPPRKMIKSMVEVCMLPISGSFFFNVLKGRVVKINLCVLYCVGTKSPGKMVVIDHAKGDLNKVRPPFRRGRFDKPGFTTNNNMMQRRPRYFMPPEEVGHSFFFYPTKFDHGTFFLNVHLYMLVFPRWR